MAFKIQDVDFREALEGSEESAISSRAQVAKTIWKVRWEDAELAKVLLIGKTTAKAGAAGNPPYWSRALPHAHPKAPWLFCDDVTKVEGRLPLPGPDDDGVARYVWAYLHCLYTKQFCEILPDDDPAVLDGTAAPFEYNLRRFVRKRRRSITQWFTSRVGSWLWLEGAGAPTRQVAMEVPWRQPKLRLALTWKNIPIKNLNEAYINDSIGTTNAVSFGGFRAQSLLLNGADWPDFFPIPGEAGSQVDVIFDVIYFGLPGRGPNWFPDPLRNNQFFEIASFSPTGIVSPIPIRDWVPIFQPINV